MALKDRTVAILVGKGTNAAELGPLQQALTEAGAEVILVGPSLEDLEQHVLSKDLTINVGLGIDVAKQFWFDAVIIPGGSSVDDYCGSEAVYDFLGAFDTARKPIAAIGRGVLLLANVDLLDGRRVAAPAELTEAIERAGGERAACAFVVDRPIFTASDVSGLPPLIECLHEQLAQVHLPAKAMANPILD